VTLSNVLSNALSNANTLPVQRLLPDRLSDRLAALLAEQVHSGALAPGDRLPTEPQLAQSHGVSKTVVREAVHQLKSKGLLISRQGSGVYVAPPAANQPLPFDPTVLGSMSAVLQIVEVRRALEGEIALIAAQRATPEHIAQMRRALETIELAVAAGGDGVAEDLAFHHCIAQATGNPQFTRLLGFLEQYLREAMRVTRGNEARYRGFRDAVRAEHKAIVNAIEARDAAAARRAANRHMVQAACRLEAGGLLQTAPVAAPPKPSHAKGNKR
jgi:GntR family transcriptional regulator, transcriptional repressor for pyruvate dehydrogenase complex